MREDAIPMTEMTLDTLDEGKLRKAVEKRFKHILRSYSDPEMFDEDAARQIDIKLRIVKKDGHFSVAWSMPKTNYPSLSEARETMAYHRDGKFMTFSAEQDELPLAEIRELPGKRS